MIWINNIVEGIKEIYNTNNPYLICDSLDIKIIYLDKSNPLLKGNEACYIRSYFNFELIYLVKNLDAIYEKFILAHEIGHAILHTEMSTAAFNIKLLNHGKYEKQATYFAIKLLEIELNEVDFYGLSSEQIASKLHLPVSALEFLY